MRRKLDPGPEQPNQRQTRGPARRSPSREERQRDAERTRERILQAAETEFSDHGYAGARVSRIAARAGVNAQLISYYFDGKAGLYQALLRQWREVMADLSQPDRPSMRLSPGSPAPQPPTGGGYDFWSGRRSVIPPIAPVLIPAWEHRISTSQIVSPNRLLNSGDGKTLES